MYILLLPIVLLLAFCLLAVCLYKKRWILSFAFALVTLFLNHYLEFFALSFPNHHKSNLKVMCFNVHFLNDNSSIKSRGLFNLIFCEDPDFVFLTEYYGSANDSLEILLNATYPYSDLSHRWANNEGDVFFSKYKIESVEQLIPSMYGGNIYRVELSNSQGTVALYCCHLFSNLVNSSDNIFSSIKYGYSKRAEESRLIANTLKNEKHPAIVMGDMNDISGSYAIRMIQSQNMKDAWWNGGVGFGNTFHDGLLQLRIDHIFYDENFEVCDIDVKHTDYSDHDALVGSFSIKQYKDDITCRYSIE